MCRKYITVAYRAFACLFFLTNCIILWCFKIIGITHCVVFIYTNLRKSSPPR